MRDFAYARPASVADAASAFAGGGEAAFIAGGHTLLPAIKSRLRMPDTLVDLSAIPGLAGVSRDGDRLWIGALTTHDAGQNGGLSQRDVVLAGAIDALA